MIKTVRGRSKHPSLTYHCYRHSRRRVAWWVLNLIKDSRVSARLSVSSRGVKKNKPPHASRPDPTPLTGGIRYCTGLSTVGMLTGLVCSVEGKSAVTAHDQTQGQANPS